MTEVSAGRLTILHSNDIHGRLAGLAQIASLVQGAKADNPDVLYFDAGDPEETNVPLSSLTKGVAMHRLLSVAGCDAAAVGNGGLLRYSHTILQKYAEAVSYPIFLANLVMPDGSSIAGTQPCGIIERAGCKLGVIGLTDPYTVYSSMFGLTSLELVPLVQGLARELRAQGADLIVVLSHLGWQHKEPREFNDLALAQALQDDIDLIIGAHTHHLLPEGEQVGRVWVAQTGYFAEHLGQIELERRADGWRVASCRVFPVPPETPPFAALVALQHELEADLEQELAQPLCQLTADFSYSPTGPSDLGYLVAEASRHYWQADAGLSLGGVGFSQPYAAGALTRGMLKRDITTAANPAMCTLTGAQLLELLERGQSPEYAEKTDLRGKRARGWLHLSGLAPEQIRPDQLYRVAATDGELDSEMGYLPESWKVKVQYHTDVILNEVLERYLLAQQVVAPQGVKA